MSRQALRTLGAVMAFAGIVILGYALYAYISQRQLEAALTAQIPGQNPIGQATTTPVALLPMPTGIIPTTFPTLDATRVSPSVTPYPTHATPVQPDETSALHVVRTATAISLLPRTPLPTDELTNILSRPTAAPTINASAPRTLGTPRGKGTVATRLIIPRLNMDIKIAPAPYATFQQNGQLISDWNVPYDAAGHLATTAQPGEIGNAVLSGHHNLSAANTFGLGVFAGLWNLAVGDEIRVGTQDGKTQLWRVKETFPIKEAGEPLSVRIQHAQQIMGDTKEPLLTLITCWNGKSNPLSGNTYRWIIHAELVNVN